MRGETAEEIAGKGVSMGLAMEMKALQSGVKLGIC